MAKERGFSYAADRVWEATGIAVKVGGPVVRTVTEPFMYRARTRGSRMRRAIANAIFDEFYKDKKEEEKK